ncbi:MAG: pilin [Candidatus Paceibacterota bacterium]
MQARYPFFAGVIVLSAVLFVSFFLPLFASAQGLVPCGGEGQPACNLCELVELGDNVLDFIIGAGVLISALLFAWAGILLVTAAGDSGQVGRAKSIFQGVIIGLIIMLAAWAIVDVILSTLTNKPIGFWNSFTCSVSQPAETQTQSLRQEASRTLTTPEREAAVQTGTLTHAQALERLELGLIQVTSTSGDGGVRAFCPTGSGCTTLTGIREATVDQLINVREACGSCTITVTGATEPDHAEGTFSHGTGYKVDLQENGQLDSFFKENLIRAEVDRGGSHGGPTYHDSCGNEYVHEEAFNHWDITVKQVCSI